MDKSKNNTMESLKILLKKREEVDKKIYDFLIEKVRQKARAILSNNKNLDEFTMCMGVYFFSNKGEIQYGYENKFFDDFMSKYDGDEKLTAFAMSFKKGGKEINHW